MVVNRLRDVDAELRRRPTALTALVVVVALTLLLCSGGLIWTSQRTPSKAELDEIRSQALDAGRSSAEVLLSYDHRTLKKDFRAGRSVATGKFLSEYRKTTEKSVRRSAEKNKVTVTAEVVSAAVVTATPDRVVLLLYVNQNTVSVLVKDGRIDQNRVQMTMVPVDDDWRVAKLNSM